MGDEKFNKAQMLIIEAFASAKTEEELNGLMDLFRRFYEENVNKEVAVSQEVLEEICL